MSNVCPYPGLRPFNEHESIFFKGRDEHIRQIIAQLARNKFIMVTGASGDGKSSLIYAGVIPNAKAGFFKAKHNSWVVADFRPERNPVKNMAHTLAKQLGCTSETEVEKQLGYGFSSLINLYKDSPYYLDTNEEKFQKLELAEQKQLKRKAANLLILVDQFEEFFTNAENYSNNQPSVEAHTAVNLLIETSKIALANDIPVYVVCTMRSDYIGQCAAFRGLPELIGFSQFFVPRLKRKEIQQVIVEPAILSGNKISNRLTQTLINELGDGLDQLPVLQHALNQVWKAADNGNQEMDLIHLVKIAGLSGGYLSDKDQADFEQWFKDVPEFKRKFFQSPSLENVLNAHANELFETAHLHYNKTHLNTVTRETAQLIIKKAFQSLTKTDGGRTVRSRMTLQEITNVIDRKEITPEIVGGILDIFRLPGNTFLRPFIESDAEYKALKNNDILDITHESLIRNWQLLADWTHEEDQNILTFRDFEKNMQRWVDSGKSSDYLLPIGPLTYFESWFLKLNPNKYWLQKYDATETSETQKLLAAETTISHGKEFIRRSARKLFFTRTVMKYGAARIAAGVALFLIMGTGVYFFFDYQSKKNENVLPKIEARCFALLNNKTVTNKEKAHFIVNEEILYPGSLQKNLRALKSDTLAIDIAIAISQNILPESNQNLTPLPDFAVTNLDVLCQSMREYIRRDTNSVSDSKLMRIVQFMDMMNFVSFRYQSAYQHSGAKPVTDLAAQFLYNRYISKVFTDSSYKNFDGAILLNALRIYMLQNKADTIGFRNLLEAISPYSNLVSKERFAKLFPPKVSIKVTTWGGEDNEINHKGGYEILATLYAGLGDIKSVSNCIDSLYIQNKGFTNSYYGGGFSDIVGFALNFGLFNAATIDNLLTRYAATSSNEKSIIIQKLINRIDQYHYPNFGKANSYMILKYLPPKINYNCVWDYYRDLLTTPANKIGAGMKPTQDENLFEMANYYKARGLTMANMYGDSVEATVNFNGFVDAYSKISEPFLNREEIYKVNSTVNKRKNYYVLLFPGNALFNLKVQGWEETWINQDYSYKLFEGFIIHKGLYKYYKAGDNELLLRLLYAINLKSSSDEVGPLKGSNFVTRFNYELIDSIAAFASQANDNEFKEEGIFELFSIDRKFKVNDTKTSLALLDTWGIDKMIKCFKANQTGYKKEHMQILIKNIACYLAKSGRDQESLKVVSILTEPYEKRNAYIGNALGLLYDGKKDESKAYLDSIISLIGSDDKFGLMILNALGRNTDKQYKDKALDLISRLGEKRKNDGLTDYVIGIAEAQQYYVAKNMVPQFLSLDREFKIYDGMIGTYVNQLMLEKQISAKDISYVTVNGNRFEWSSNEWESSITESSDNIIFFGD